MPLAPCGKPNNWRIQHSLDRVTLRPADLLDQLSLIRLVDDVRPLGPQAKFIIQVLVASIMVAMGLQLHLTGAPVIDLLVTLFDRNNIPVEKIGDSGGILSEI